jgi:hypothetical protein
MYCNSDVTHLRLSCCINAFIFCVHYLCLIGRVYVSYVGHVDKSSLYETIFYCNILSKHHHHHEQVDINLIMGTGQGLLTPLVRYDNAPLFSL